MQQDALGETYREDVARREKAQLPLEEKRALADHSIPNHGSLEDLEQALAELDRRLA